MNLIPSTNMKLLRKSLLLLCLLLPFGAFAQSNGQLSPNYEIQPSDLLQVKVFQESDLERQGRVSQDGTLELALIGRIDIAGKTVAQARDLIYQLYDRDYLVNPSISLDVLEYSQRRVNVLGAVNAPGQIAFPPEETMNVVDAISRAGGFNRYANTRSVVLTRQNGDGSTETFTVNVDQILNGNSSADWTLQRGDVIHVPESRF